MNKAELIAEIAGKTGLTKKDGEKALNALLETIQESIANGEKVSIYNFGTYEVVKRAPRTARNPKTGEAVKVGAKSALKFKPAPALKATVR